MRLQNLQLQRLEKSNNTENKQHHQFKMRESTGVSARTQPRGNLHHHSLKRLPSLRPNLKSKTLQAETTQFVYGFL